MIDEGGSTHAPAQVLRERGLHPRKRLGQNFLRDRSVLPVIAGAAEISTGDRILEIGAGTGVLTAELVNRGANVVAIELDDALNKHLVSRFADLPQVQLWHGNALDFDPCLHIETPYKIVGNIPYYITGPILRHFLEAACAPTLMVLMVQWEVAERICALPPDLSLLGVSVQAYAEPTVITRVPAGAFFPPPKVESAVIRLQIRPHAVFGEDARSFFDVVRAGFGVRRKQLSNALANGLAIPPEEAKRLLRAAGIDSIRRAETLDLSEWARLAMVWKVGETS